MSVWRILFQRGLKELGERDVNEILNVLKKFKGKTLHIEATVITSDNSKIPVNAHLTLKVEDWFRK